MRARHHRPGGGYQNPWPASEVVGAAGMLRWWRDRLRDPPPSDPDPLPFGIGTPAFARPCAPTDVLTFTWVGHATFLIQIGGLNLLTDPIWSKRASPVPWVGPRRAIMPGIGLDDLPQIDAVLISHDHYDHLDDLTVCRLEARNPGARWVVPLGLDAFLRRRGVREITMLDWWQDTQHGPLTLACTPAQHFSGRAPWRRNTTLWCGWCVASPSRRIFFAGDTGNHPEFAAIAERYGPFDAVVLPIGAYEPRWLMRSVHMNPEEAVQAYQALTAGTPAPRGTRLVPMHWGTFRLTDEPLDEPPLRARAAWAAAALKPELYSALAHGDTLVI